MKRGEGLLDCDLNSTCIIYNNPNDQIIIEENVPCSLWNPRASWSYDKNMGMIDKKEKLLVMNFYKENGEIRKIEKGNKVIVTNNETGLITNCLILNPENADEQNHHWECDIQTLGYING